MTEFEWRSKFKNKLSEIMSKKDVNQLRLARMTGLSNSRISDYVNEKATPSIFAVINIAYALDVSIGELIDFDETIRH